MRSERVSNVCAPKSSGDETTAMNYKLRVEWTAAGRLLLLRVYTKHGISADITNIKLHNGQSWSDQEPSPGEGAGSERRTFT